MFQPSVKVICDSLSLETGERLTTMILNYHRFIHSEFMTYRNFSRNCASSRSVNIKKSIENVENLNLQPLHWGKNRKGMQAVEEIQDISYAKEVWEHAKADAILHAKTLDNLGIHKQVVNRILEPFNDITVICTANLQAYQHFFNQRCHPDAQPEIRALAYKMKEVLELSEPQELKENDWHIPFNRFIQVGKDQYQLLIKDSEKGLKKSFSIRDVIRVSVGCCARVSYLNHEGVRNVQNDLDLHDKLTSAKPPHLSPLEHQAVCFKGSFANFRGFRSYRNILESLTVI